MSDETSKQVRELLARTLMIIEDPETGKRICVQCALRASLEGREATLIQETAEEHFRTVHSGAAQSAIDAKLEAKLREDYERDMQSAIDAQPKTRELFQQLVMRRQGKVDPDDLQGELQKAGFSETVAVLAVKRFARAHRAGRGGAMNN